MDWERQAAGADLRRWREDREDHGNRSPEEVRELREQAAKSATVCANCFEPLANNATFAPAPIADVGRSRFVRSSLP